MQNFIFIVVSPSLKFGNPATIRENQAIRANPRIDSRELGHLSTIGPAFTIALIPRNIIAVTNFITAM